MLLFYYFFLSLQLSFLPLMWPLPSFGSISVRSICETFDCNICVFSGQLSLDVSTVYGILAAADLLLMDEAKQLCAGFLLRMLTSSAGIEENLRIRRSAQLYRLREIEAASDAVVAMSFAQVCYESASRY